MADKDKDEARRVFALLVHSAAHEQTAEEAEAELVADGVDVESFLASVETAVSEKKKEERLAWRKEARVNIAEFDQTNEMLSRFAAMSDAEVFAEARRHADQLHFKNLQETTADDLRTQLADRARLAELPKKRK